jgi:hypothetical protein
MYKNFVSIEQKKTDAIIKPNSKNMLFNIID